MLHNCSFSFFSVFQGTYSINGIMGPDEYHGPVNDSVYCNVVAKYSMEAAYTLAKAFGRPPNATFNTIAQNLRILFDPVNQVGL